MAGEIPQPTIPRHRMLARTDALPPDSTLAETVLNFPEYVIPEQGRRPGRVPSLLAIDDGNELYSVETYAMLLQYATAYVRKGRSLTANQTQDLIAFKVSLDRAIKNAARDRSINFLSDEQASNDYQLFNRILNLRNFREGQDPISSVPKVSDLLPQHRRPLRWFRASKGGGSLTD